MRTPFDHEKDLVCSHYKEKSNENFSRFAVGRILATTQTKNYFVRLLAQTQFSILPLLWTFHFFCPKNVVEVFTTTGKNFQ